MSKTIRTLEGGKYEHEEIVSEDCYLCGYDRMIHVHYIGPEVHTLTCLNPDCSTTYEP